MPFAGYDDFDACVRDNSDVEDPEAYCAQVHYEVTGDWPSEKFEKKFNSDAVINTPLKAAEIMTKADDILLGTWNQIDMNALDLLKSFVEQENDPRRVKQVIDMVKLSRSEDVDEVLSKADSIEKLEFDANVDRSVQMVLKQDEEFLIWGPASVEVVDKEKDKISINALDKALPQLLKRARLSYNHTDQIVGRILENFETEEPVEVTIDGKTYERSEFPTDVLEMSEDENPALYVAGEVYSDTQQSQNVRKEIEDGKIDSYSISGEALVTQKQVDGDMVYDDILELDLSAVTLCEEGMNQEAKFAQINDNVESVETAEAEKYEKEYDLAEGNVTSAKAVAKSMTNEEEQDGLDPDNFVKSDEIEGDLASKEYVSEELAEAVDKTVDAVVDELDGSVVKEEEFEKRVEDIASATAKEAFESHFPDGDLVTRSYVEDLIEREDHDDEEEEMEDKGDDYEEGEEEEMEEEMEEGGEEMERTFTRDDLEEELPGDVWSAVSEYIGDNKRQKSEETQTKTENPEELTEDDLTKAVKSVLKGEDIQTPGTDLGGREDELDEILKEADSDEDEEVVDGSPALDKWN